MLARPVSHQYQARVGSPGTCAGFQKSAQSPGAAVTVPPALDCRPGAVRSANLCLAGIDEHKVEGQSRDHPIRRRSHQGSSSQLRRARSRSSSTWGSSCPTTSPTAAAGTLKSLSTISWEGLCRPLRPEGSTAIRTKGACLRVLVSGQRVTLGWA